MYNPWEANANHVKDYYGGYVSYAEECYLCPECGEPIYKDEWTPEELTAFICPVCKWEGD